MFDREGREESVQVVNGPQAVGIEGRVLHDGQPKVKVGEKEWVAIE